MIVYLDLVIGSTLVVNYAMIKTIALVFHEKLKIWRIITALFFSVLVLGMFILPFKWLINIRYFMGVPIVLLAFSYHNIKDTIIKTVIFYFLNVAFIGTLVIFKIKNLYLLLVALLYVLICWIIENYKNGCIKENTLTYIVKIGDCNIKGFLDTGNQAYYQGIPIVFIKNKYFNNQYQKLGTTRVGGIGGFTTINVYKGPPVEVVGNSYIVYFAFSDHINHEMILHQELGEKQNA